MDLMDAEIFMAIEERFDMNMPYDLMNTEWDLTVGGLHRIVTDHLVGQGADANEQTVWDGMVKIIAETLDVPEDRVTRGSHLYHDLIE